MKKILFLFIVAASLVACNNDGTSTETVKDSVLEAVDSTGDARADSIKQATDSIGERLETTFEKTDSANKVIADSLEQK